MRKHLWPLLPAIAALVAGSSIFVHPYGDIKDRVTDTPLMNDSMVDPGVGRLLEKSCRNCHSENTQWPWYSYIAPMSWLIEGDVYEARKHMNLSHWDEYDLEKKQAILAEIAVMVKNRKMPLPILVASSRSEAFRFRH